jgi:hypothetical protein
MIDLKSKPTIYFTITALGFIPAITEVKTTLTTVTEQL